MGTFLRETGDLRKTGDLIHLIAIVLLLHRIFVVKNAQGLSRKTQELYLLVFITRYVDLFLYFISFYNSFMKIVYIASTGILVLALTVPNQVQETYRAEQDDFPHWKYLAWPCFVVGFFVTLIQSVVGDGFRLFELLVTVSFLLEAVATVPQILLYRKYRQVESITGGNFILLMAVYRFMYILQKIVSRQRQLQLLESHNFNLWFGFLCAVVQAGLGFAGFFWPPENETGTAPLLLQLQRTWEGMRNQESVRFFCFTFVLPIALYHVGRFLRPIGQDLHPVFTCLLFLWYFTSLAFAIQRLVALRQPTEPRPTTNTAWQWYFQLHNNLFGDRPTTEAGIPIESTNVLTEPLLEGSIQTQAKDGQIEANEPQDEELSPDIRVV